MQEIFTDFLLIPEEALLVDNNMADRQYIQRSTQPLNSFPAAVVDFTEEDPYAGYEYRLYSAEEENSDATNGAEDSSPTEHGDISPPRLRNPISVYGRPAAGEDSVSDSDDDR